MQAMINAVRRIPFFRSVDSNAMEREFFSTILDDDYSVTVMDKKEPIMKEVFAMEDLPSVGDPSLVYKVTSTSDMFRWVNGQYVTYNPYLDPKEIHDERVMLIDPYANMPSISEDKLKAGGDMRLSMIYNVQALREDLRRLNELGVNLEVLIDRNLRQSGYDTPSTWLIQNHTLLVRQLRSIMKGKNNYDKHVVEGLALQGVDVWYDIKTQRVGFRDGLFVVAV
ncbi:hypothetical protein AVT69_gp142 [Pseudomonas phage PhiPA3]|uniref:Uncharacterized protein 144 n=1 Tax=Pseudomonas phage PhiPA3 TaxID=998086 RepID=F8SK17_BPPA3|nr:hypothetical protein AVT69_gp142 [Pseudomonas phage PhiPA3]AEH03567.1 hypothetical protein [Pseudomonas phage PhiPA3]